MRGKSERFLLKCAPAVFAMSALCLSFAEGSRICSRVAEDGTMVFTNVCDPPRGAAPKSPKPPEDGVKMKDVLDRASFIRRAGNEIANNDGAMTQFYGKLAALQNREKDKVVIYHVGDSHVRSLFFPRHFARAIQGRFGERGGTIFYSDLSKRTGRTGLLSKSGSYFESGLQGVPLSETPSPRGIAYYAYGVGGKSFGYFTASSVLREQLAAYKPDLVIVSLGTNDAFAPSFTRRNVLADISRLTTAIMTARPGAAILFTIPPDSFWRPGQVNSQIQVVRSAIIEFCRGRGFGYWDLYTVMGGERSMERWYDAGLAGEDRVHFRGMGYQIQGELLYEAISSGYDRFRNGGGNAS